MSSKDVANGFYIALSVAGSSFGVLGGLASIKNWLTLHGEDYAERMQQARLAREREAIARRNAEALAENEALQADLDGASEDSSAATEAELEASTASESDTELSELNTEASKPLPDSSIEPLE